MLFINVRQQTVCGRLHNEFDSNWSIEPNATPYIVLNSTNTHLEKLTRRIQVHKNECRIVLQVNTFTLVTL